jgi:heme A synthase
LLSLIALLVAAWRHRTEPGVGGPGGVLRSAALAVALGVSAALLGAITVKLGNVPFATLAHWTVAMSLVATVVATVIRAGGLGGATALAGGAAAKTQRASLAAAAMALAAVVMGGLTAKYPGAAVACPSFPLCGTNPDVRGAAVHVQLTHRVLAVLLVLHLFGIVMALRKRQEAPLIRRAATIAFSLGVLQLLVAGAMVGMHLPPVLRSLHEATGVSIWIATFALAYLARVASGGAAVPRITEYPSTPTPAFEELTDAGVIRATAGAPRQALSSAVAETSSAVAELEPWQAPVVLPALSEVVAGLQSFTTEDAGDAEAEFEPREPQLETGPVRAELVAAVSADEEVDLATFPSSTSIDLVATDEVEPAMGMPVLAYSALQEPRASISGRESEHVPPAQSAPRSTMTHSVAVIVARGADL